MVYNLVETATGKLISDSFDAITVTDPNNHVVETADRLGVWNTSTLSYDPHPARRIIDVSIFINRFTDLETEDLVEAAKTVKKANTFLKILPIIGVADLDSTFIQTAINGMETLGIIGAGRALEILADG